MTSTTTLEAPPVHTSKRAEQKARTRAEILHVAKQVFAEQGIMATTTADVANAAGISHGTVFLHFPTRDNLIAAVIAETGMGIARKARARAVSGSSVREVLAAHLASIADEEAFYRRLVIESPLLPKEARNTLVGIQSAVSTHLSQAVEHDVAAGLVQPMPLHLLFNTWIGLIHYYLANRDLFAPGGSVVASRGDELLDHYMELLAPKEGGKDD